MRCALADAQLGADDIDYVHAHGTGTRHNDGVEAAAVASVFAAGRVMVSSTKGATGHMIGASGAFGAFASLMAMRHGVVPPTLNLHDPDTGCHLDLVPLVARECRPRACLTNSFAFGGQNASLVLASA
jgi:3-oxoacyl-(acyl-carrier-protein) synthase